MAYKGALMVTDDQLLAGFARCKELGALPQARCGAVVWAHVRLRLLCARPAACTALRLAHALPTTHTHTTHTTTATHKNTKLNTQTQVHAENGDAVAEGQRRVFEAGVTGPEGHALSRPAVLEAEATGRAIRLAAFVGVPLYVVHVMSAAAAEEVWGRGGGGEGRRTTGAGGCRRAALHAVFGLCDLARARRRRRRSRARASAASASSASPSPLGWPSTRVGSGAGRGRCGIVCCSLRAARAGGGLRSCALPSAPTAPPRRPTPTPAAGTRTSTPLPNT